MGLISRKNNKRRRTQIQFEKIKSDKKIHWFVRTDGGNDDLPKHACFLRTKKLSYAVWNFFI